MPEQNAPAPELKRKSMVGWYDPMQLLKTAQEVIISTIFGKHADRRLVQVLGSEKMPPYDYTLETKQQGAAQENMSAMAVVERKEIWIDYISDVGDGWNSTYAVAHYAVQGELKVDGLDQPLPRGNIMILGGDEVYPTANRQEYADRLEHPYAVALQNYAGIRPHIFAIPGNHDWYDSLVSFSSMFFDKSYFPLFEEENPHSDDQPGLWRVPQERSYFALKLPHGYWLIGVDVQLDHDLDIQQIQYFKELANPTNDLTQKDKMRAGDKIILCCAEPFWVYTGMYSAINPKYKNTRLGRDYLEKQVFHQQKIVAYFAGDLHHYYSLFDKEKGVARITAGGGGAFLHPTHGELAKAFKDYDENEYSDHTKHSFPSVKESSSLGLGNFAFLFKNWKFGSLTAIVYFLAAWSVLAFFSDTQIVDLESTVAFGDWLAKIADATFYVALKTPVAFLWGIGIFAGFLLFTDTHKMSYRVIAGSLHGLTHVAACLLISWTGHWLVTHTLKEFIANLSNDQNVIRNWNLVISALIIFALAWIVSSVIMGLYLFVSLNIFGRHSNEAFSSLANQDFKNFLRLKIDASGLTIYPLGIRRVPRKWRKAMPGDNTISAVVSDDGSATNPHLIQSPIHIPNQA